MGSEIIGMGISFLLCYSMADLPQRTIVPVSWKSGVDHETRKSLFPLEGRDSRHRV